MADWIVHPDAKKRVFEITSNDFDALASNQRQREIESAQGKMEDRYSKIFQRRHDCIHNCDRPKVAPQALKSSKTVLKVIQDAEFLVYRCDEHINAEFREFLLRIGCNEAIIQTVGYAKK